MVDRVQVFDPKAPTGVGLYQFNLAGWLAAGDSWASSALLSVTPPDLSVSTPVIQDPYVNVVISGGTNGTRYAIEILVTSSLERADPFIALISVIDPAAEVVDLIGPGMAGNVPAGLLVLDAVSTAGSATDDAGNAVTDNAGNIGSST